MKEAATYTLKAMEANDEAVLSEMLYQAIFVPEGSVPPSREVVHLPALSKYIEDFGRPGDLGYVALNEIEQPVGAAWLRLLTGANKGYGYVNDETPELTVAVMPDYRGQGLGTALLECLLENARAKYQSVSLSVWLENPAYRLYQRLGFETVKQNPNDVVMLKRL
jgi:ribosomal protein S18 acetylase RimI-like enzyme